MEQLGVIGKLVASDVTDSSPTFHFADEGIAVPRVGRLEYMPALIDIVKQHDIGLLVPLTDLDLRSLSRQQDKFVELGCTVMIAPEETVAVCRDKTRTNEIVSEAGLAQIETHTLQEFRANPFYPCFVKPIRGSASVGACVIENSKQLRSHVSKHGDLLVIQEQIVGPEYTIDVYRGRDGQVHSVVPRQRLAIRSGEVEKAVTIKDEELISQATRLVSNLSGLWGVCCCQCRRDDTGTIRFFEVNPRFGGGAPLSIAAGANLPLYLLQEVLGEPITAECGQFTENLLMMRYDEAVFNQVDRPDQLPGYKYPFSH